MSRNIQASKGPSLVIESEADPTIFDDEPLELEDAPEDDAPGGADGTEDVHDGAGADVPDADKPSKDAGDENGSSFLHTVGAIFWNYAQGHPHTVIYGIVGLVLALMVLIVGFWPTFLIALFVGIGVVIGQVVDGDGVIVQLIERFFGGGEEQ